MGYIKFFNQLSLADVALVGGKNASLGQMVQHLEGVIRVPDGFAVTVDAFRDFVTESHLQEFINEQLARVNFSQPESLAVAGTAIRSKIIEMAFAEGLKAEITQAYKKLSSQYNQRNLSVAVRSSAVSEDLPTASAAGQQESYLHIKGVDQLLLAIKKCMASLFTDRAITYRHEKGLEQAVGISVGVQKMVRADRAVSGVMFSLETDSGHKDFVTINASWGLGEAVVQGSVTPDEYLVHKQLLTGGFKPLVKKTCGDKRVTYAYHAQTRKVSQRLTPVRKQQQFCLSNDEVFELAHAAIAIENYYSSLTQSWSPMDIEWAQDQDDGKFYIVQARPETVHVHDTHDQLAVYVSTERSAQPLVAGMSVGRKIATGRVRVISSLSNMREFNDGEILVTPMTDPDWLPIMKRASAVITDHGGRTCHAAIVARELGIPALVGAQTATQVLKPGQEVTVDTSQGAQGFVYAGKLAYEVKNITLQTSKQPVELMVNIAVAETACQLAQMPISGVGLMRLEFVIAHEIGIHPQAILHPEKVVGAPFKKLCKKYIREYGSLREYYIQKLSQHIGLIAAAFYPRPVIVRLTDFKSNEYKDLHGGRHFEPEEENPMLGFRGACRYTDVHYQKAFELECEALSRARNVMGLTNIIIMVPFVRTVAEARKTIELLSSVGLERSDTLKIYQMIEVPSNVLLFDQFQQYFDGFSIGSNDLTQLTLGVDRDSGLLRDLFNEQDPAVMMLIELAIRKAHAAGKPIGICGQAPSDFPEFIQWLAHQKIDSISLNADALIAFL